MKRPGRRRDTALGGQADGHRQRDPRLVLGRGPVPASRSGRSSTARRLVAEGADLLDVGGESTRPGARGGLGRGGAERVEPVVEGLRDVGAPISIDTSKVAVAEAALDAGAEIVNDVTALRAEPGARGALRRARVRGRAHAHAGRPAHDAGGPDLRGRRRRRQGASWPSGSSSRPRQGVAEERIWIDPGIGFGKTVEHNLELLRRLGELRELGRPIVVGTSRKSFIGKLDRPRGR